MLFRSVLAVCALACPFLLVMQAQAGEHVWASWYGKRFHGRLTASGAPFNMHAMTFAHKSLPFGTKVRFCFRRCAIGTASDRGPYSGHRSYDLAKGLADAIGLTAAGVALIRVERVR